MNVRLPGQTATCQAPETQGISSDGKQAQGLHHRGRV